jgi:hypothetical protein
MGGINTSGYSAHDDSTPNGDYPNERRSKGGTTPQTRSGNVKGSDIPS